MFIEMQQVSNELFSAEHKIICNNEVIGTVSVKTSKLRRESDITVNLLGSEYTMNYGHKNVAKDKSCKPFRIYDIYADGTSAGAVYQAEIKGDTLFSSYIFHRMHFNGNIYENHSIGKDDISISSIWLKDIEIAEVHNDSVIYNEMYNFRIYVKDLADAVIPVLFFSYIYTIAFYQVGQKVTDGVHRYPISKPQAKAIEKYNANFIKLLD